jgi:hypothetical protein
MRRSRFVLLTGALAAAPGAAGLPGPPPPLVARAEGPRERPAFFQGEVTAVDGRSITVRGWDLRTAGRTRSDSDEYGMYRTESGDPLVVTVGGRSIACAHLLLTRDVLTLTLPGGEVARFHRADQPDRRFPADEVLAAGGFDRREPPAATYRLGDVRVGDFVTVLLRPVGDEDVCRGVCIYRRPGGRVPPAPGEAPDARNPHHEWANAWQDFEEQEIPLPAKYDPVQRRRRQRETLELVRSQAARERVAPPPREVKPKPPGS